LINLILLRLIILILLLPITLYAWLKIQILNWLLLAYIITSFLNYILSLLHLLLILNSVKIHNIFFIWLIKQIFKNVILIYARWLTFWFPKRFVDIKISVYFDHILFVFVPEHHLLDFSQQLLFMVYNEFVWVCILAPDLT
jgi:hypothetical protein